MESGKKDDYSDDEFNMDAADNKSEICTSEKVFQLLNRISNVEDYLIYDNVKKTRKSLLEREDRKIKKLNQIAQKSKTLNIIPKSNTQSLKIARTDIEKGSQEGGNDPKLEVIKTQDMLKIQKSISNVEMQTQQDQSVSGILDNYKNLFSKSKMDSAFDITKNVSASVEVKMKKPDASELKSFQTPNDVMKDPFNIQPG